MGRVCSRLGGGAVVLLVVLGVACASAAPAPQPAPAAPATTPAAAPLSADAPQGPPAVPVPEREHIRVMYGSVSGSMAPLWIADDKQLFKKYGLAVDVQYAETTIGASALVSGDAQFNINDGVSGFHAIAAGSPIKMIATFGTKNNYAIVVRPEITSPGDLRGKTIACGPAIHGCVGADRPQALRPETRRGRTAAAGGQLADAVVSLAHRAGRRGAAGRGVRGPGGGAGHARAHQPREETGRTLSTVVLMPTEFGRANPNTVQAFLKTMIEATKFYADPANRAEVLPLMARQLKLDPSDPTVADAYEYFHVRLKRDPTPDRDGAEAILDALRGIDPAVYQTFTVEDVLDSSYMNTLVASGFVQAVYGSP